MTIFVIMMKLEQEVAGVREKFGEEIIKMGLINLSIENDRLMKDVNNEILDRKIL